MNRYIKSTGLIILMLFATINSGYSQFIGDKVVNVGDKPLKSIAIIAVSECSKKSHATDVDANFTIKEDKSEKYFIKFPLTGFFSTIYKF